MKKTTLTIISFLSVFIISGCGSDDSTDSPSYSIPNNTNDGYLYGDFSLTINSIEVQNSPVSKTYSNNYLNGTYSLSDLADQYQNCIDLSAYYGSLNGADNLQKASWYHRYADKIAEFLYNDFYLYSSNTILNLTSDGSASSISVESVKILDDSVIDKIEMVFNNIHTSDINTELIFDSTTSERYLIFTDKNGNVFTSLASGSSVTLVIGNISTVGNLTTITIKNGSILYINTIGLESISIQGTINAYREN